MRDHATRMIREDYLMRLIRQLAEVLARAAGFNTRRKYDEAVDELQRAWEELLETPRNLLEVVDDATLAELLREPAKMRIAAQLLAEEARAIAGKGDPVNAAVLSKRAMRLYASASVLDPTEDDDAAILELSRAVPPGAL